jgi:demethylmenaquinone methyltransferase / 2-methoxy-6-polyprenyl-1,4-benzoquinol methylase
MKARSGSSEAFSGSAAAYAATMAPNLRVMAAEVVRRARLQPGERVLDVGTGTGIGAAAALGEGRNVFGLDAAEGMLEIARREVHDATFVKGDFGAIPFDDEDFEAVIAVHCLLFAEDPVTVLREWRRVTRPGGRLSLSVPGPADRTPHTIYGEIYARYGIDTLRSADYPEREELGAWVHEAGWAGVATAADPDTAIRLPDEAAFRRWLTVGSRGAATRDWPPERLESFACDLLAATPRDGDGVLHIPFGSLYATARRPQLTGP